MSVWQTVMVIGMIGLVFIMIHKLMGHHHPVRGAVLSMLCGILTLAVVNLCFCFTGVDLPVSRLSLAIAAVLGIPGVTAMLLLQLLC